MLEQGKLWVDVKKLRLERGWLQKEAADKLGVTRSYLSYVENDRRGLSPKMIAAIINVFNLSLEDFMIRVD